MAKKNLQWHPLFARLLRTRVEGYYEVQTDVPVGDLPRQADLLLVRRIISQGTLPFQGMWRWLTTWNVFEFKGRSVVPRLRHLPLLVEVGLGIDRRLNEERARQRQKPLPEREVSFWYIVNRLSPRFLVALESRLNRLETLAPGVWRGSVLGYTLFLVSTVDLLIDEDSLPMHLLGLEPLEKQRQIGAFLAEDRNRLIEYGSLFANLHPATMKEFVEMARNKQIDMLLDIRWMVDEFGLDKIVKHLGEKDVIEQIGKKEFIKQIGKKEVIEQIGEKEVIEQIGEKKVLKQMGIEKILANLSPSQRLELERRFKAGSDSH